jgi:hypothetical protein
MNLCAMGCRDPHLGSSHRTMVDGSACPHPTLFLFDLNSWATSYTWCDQIWTKEPPCLDMTDVLSHRGKTRDATWPPQVYPLPRLVQMQGEIGDKARVGFLWVLSVEYKDNAFIRNGHSSYFIFIESSIANRGTKRTVCNIFGDGDTKINVSHTLYLQLWPIYGRPRWQRGISFNRGPCHWGVVRVPCP